MSIISTLPSIYTIEPDPHPPIVYASEYDYSLTEENLIGKWIDNKYLYQKVVKFTNSDITGTNLSTIQKLAHNIADIDMPLFMKDVTELSTASAANRLSKWPLPMNVASTSYTSQYHYYLERFTKTQIWIRRGTNTSEQDTIYIAVQYTKTT